MATGKQTDQMIPEFDPFKTPALVEDYRGGLTPVKILKLLPPNSLSQARFLVRVVGERDSMWACVESNPYPKGLEYEAAIDHTLPRKCVYLPRGCFYPRVKPHKWKGV